MLHISWDYTRPSGFLLGGLNFSHFPRQPKYHRLSTKTFPSARRTRTQIKCSLPQGHIFTPKQQSWKTPNVPRDPSETHAKTQPRTMCCSSNWYAFFFVVLVTLYLQQSINARGRLHRPTKKKNNFGLIWVFPSVSVEVFGFRANRVFSASKGRNLTYFRNAIVGRARKAGK